MHGNVSSSLFWQQPLLALAATGRHRALAVDLRGYGDTEPLPIDATRGVRDWADDLAALVDALGLDRVHLVGWSMGARRRAAVPARRTRSGWRRWRWWRRCRRTASAGRPAPTGTRVHADGTGSRRRARPTRSSSRRSPPGDTTADSPVSPRSVLRAFYVAPGSLPLDPQLEDVFVAAMNSTRTGATTTRATR